MDSRTDEEAEHGTEEEMEDVVAPGASWNVLPFELHLKILHLLAEDELHSKLLAEYALVCKSWQTQIEEVNFRSLTVRHGDLEELDQIVRGRRRAWLKHLWLMVELDKYPHRLRVTPENEQEQETNNYSFTTALFDLFTILEKWDTADFWTARNGRGMSLEVTASSPSDRANLFGEAGLDHDGNSRFFDSLLDFYLLALSDPQGIHGLPMINVVTSFSILRRNYRNISATALTPILRSLPRLEEVRLEPWQQVDHPAQEDVDSELASQLPFWPHHLKRVSIFEHFGVFDQHESWDSPRSNRLPFLSHCQRRMSTNLEELSLSYMADAKDFFQPFMKQSARNSQLQLPQWPHLRWLTITSSLISDNVVADEINSLLQGAGQAVKNMPSLQAMELYNANRWCAGVFRYLVVNDVGVVSWTSTWEFKLKDSVKRVWRQVARHNTRREPYIFDEVELTGYNGDAEGFIHSNLTTRALVLHPISSEAMMRQRPYPEPVLRLKTTPFVNWRPEPAREESSAETR